MIKAQKRDLTPKMLHKTLALIYLRKGDSDMCRQIIYKWKELGQASSDQLDYLKVKMLYVKQVIEAGKKPS